MATEKPTSQNKNQKISTKAKKRPISPYALAVYTLALFILVTAYFYPHPKSTHEQIPPHISLQKDTIDINKDECKELQSEKTPVNINVNDLIKLSMKLESDRILASPSIEQTFPMLVSLEVEGLEISERKPVDLVCIVDSSANMTDEKLGLIRNTLRYLVTFLSDEDRLSIVISNHQAPTLVPLINMTRENQDKVLSALWTMDLKGLSIFVRGFEIAQNILEHQRELINQQTGVLLISDELENPANDDAIECLQEFCTTRAEIFRRNYLIGGPIPKCIFLMAGLKSSTNGNLFFLDKLDNTAEAFAFVKSLAVFQTSIAKSVEFFIKAESEYVELSKDLKDNLMWRKEGELFITKESDLITRRQKDVMLDLRIPSFPLGLPNSSMEVKVASCEAVITLHNGSQVVKKADLRVTLLQGEAELGSEKENEEVMERILRVKMTELIEKGKKLMGEEFEKTKREYYEALWEMRGERVLLTDITTNQMSFL